MRMGFSAEMQKDRGRGLPGSAARRRAIRVALCLVVLFLCGLTSAQTNLVTNGTFTGGITGWTKLPDHAGTIFGSFTGCALTYAAPTDGAAAGLCIQAISGGWRQGIYQVISGLQPGAIYELKADGQIYTDQSVGNDYLTLFWVNGTTIDFDYSWPGSAESLDHLGSEDFTSTSWKPLNGRFQPSVSAVVVGVVANFNGDEWCYMLSLVDDISLVLSANPSMGELALRESVGAGEPFFPEVSDSTLCNSRFGYPCSISNSNLTDSRIGDGETVAGVIDTGATIGTGYDEAYYGGLWTAQRFRASITYYTTQVRVAWQCNDATSELRIYKGDTPSSSGLLASQSFIPDVSDGWSIIDLDTPIFVEQGQRYALAFRNTARGPYGQVPAPVLGALYTSEDSPDTAAWATALDSVGIRLELYTGKDEEVPAGPYHVATTGSDTAGDGSTGSPFFSIGKAMVWAGRSADASPEIRIACGTYYETVCANVPDLSLVGGFDPVTWTRGPASPLTVVDGNNKGTGIVVMANAATLDGITVANGRAELGGGIRVWSAGESVTLVKSCVLSNNHGTVNGGGVHLSGAGKLRMQETLLQGNTTSGWGGGAYLSSSVEIIGCTFSGNTATQSGGAIAGRATYPQLIVDTEITGNTASVSGGGIHLTGGADLVDCTLTANTASGYGGAVAHIPTSATIAFLRCVVQDNSAVGRGGGAYCTGQARFEDTTLAGNRVSGGSVSGVTYQGGGVYCGNGSTILRSTVSGNACRADSGSTNTFRGAGVYAAGSATVTESDITGNSLAIAAAGSNNIFQGAGIYAAQPVGLYRCRVEDNDLSIVAGGSGNAFTGAGVYAAAGGTFHSNVLANNVIAGANTARAGGLWIGTGAGNRIHSNTIAANSADGLYIFGSPDVWNNIVANHPGYQIAEGDVSSDAPLVNNVLWGPSGTLFLNEGDAPLNDIALINGLAINSDNLCFDPWLAADGHYLRTGSPCIDAGIATDAPTDIEGQTRGYGAGYDVGADEYYGVHPSDLDENHVVDDKDLVRYGERQCDGEVTQEALDAALALWKCPRGYLVSETGQYSCK